MKRTNRLFLGASAVGLLFACGPDRQYSDAEQSEVLTSRGGDTAMPDLNSETSTAGAGGASEVGQLGLEVAPSNLDFHRVTVGFPARSRLSILNTGTASVQGVVASFGIVAGPFELLQNQCPESLAPNAHCELRVQFIPSAEGNATAELTIEDSSGSALVVPFSGSGVAAGALVLVPATGSFEDFGGVRVGERAEGIFSLTNPTSEATGPLSLDLSREEYSIVAPAPGQCISGTTSLADGESCDITIAFAPTARGPVETTLIGLSESAGSVSVALEGHGLVPGEIVASTDSLDFDGVVLGGRSQRTVTFSNAGDEVLTLSGARLLSSDVTPFSIETSNCGADTLLQGGESCSVDLGFQPLSAGELFQSQLQLDLIGGNFKSVELSGIGLKPGSLLVGPIIPDENDFGSVLIGERVERSFQITNPGAQSSGVIALTAGGDFEVVSPPLEGDCINGETSLVDGESCGVRVRFVPTLRQSSSGSLTVASALAGASSLVLSGKGILPAIIDATTEVNFGRVLTGATASRNIVVRNAGDLPLENLALQIEGSSTVQSLAFSAASECVTPLGFDEECTISVSFEPTTPVPHAANLLLTAASELSSTSLLLGEALTPGSLVVVPQGGSLADFGDLEVGGSTSGSFTVTNPGNIGSGRLTVTTDNSHFAATPGDCAGLDATGLIDGSSCILSVEFTPDDSALQVANLSILSATAGVAVLEIRGRGRAPAELIATTTRDFGRGNLGQAELTEPSNEFSWTVNNDGDLATGVLLATTSSPEFELAGGTCAGVELDGRSSCLVSIRFRPSAAGNRTASIVVSDSASDEEVTLNVTGLGVQLAGPGESCLNATCSEGVCTAGVCCNQACNLSCQQCNAAGVCETQSNQESCGSAGGVCFGVEQCALPSGSECGNTSDCGGGLVCKECGGGGRECTAPDLCCGACPGSLSCVGGSCGCAANQIDCGGNLCISNNQANVCCPVAPDCAGNLNGCTDEGRCVECTQASQCQNGGPGTVAVCQNNNTCSYRCGNGQRDCGGGRCVAAGQCCSDNDCGSCGRCNGTTNACQDIGRGQQGRCAGGNLCDGNGACFAPQCTNDNGCSECSRCNTNTFLCFQANTGSSCSNGRVCSAAGSCVQCLSDNDGQCGNGCNEQAGQCNALRGNLATCGGNAQCSSGRCATVFNDDDQDGYAVAGAASRRICLGQGVRAAVIASQGVTDRSPNNRASTDCCDESELINPGVTAFLSVSTFSILAACPGYTAHDNNCNGVLEPELPPTLFINCEGPANVACAARSGIVVGAASPFGYTAQEAESGALCGVSSSQYNRCSGTAANCTTSGQTAPRCR